MSIHFLTHADLPLYRADQGWTAITIEICPNDPVTVLMPDDNLEVMLSEFQRMVIAQGAFDSSDVADYAAMRRTMAERLVPAVAGYNELEIVNCAVVAIWCATHHPRDGGAMQLKMTLIKARGVAPHFTICRGPKGAYGTAIAENYIDLRGDLADRIDPRQTTLAVR